MTCLRRIEVLKKERNFLFVLFLVNKALKRYLVSFGKLSGLYRFVFLPLLKNWEEPQEMNERDVTKAPPGASDLETLWLMVGILTPNKRNRYIHPPVSFNCLSSLEELRLIQSVRGWRLQQHMTKICFLINCVNCNLLPSKIPRCDIVVIGS